MSRAKLFRNPLIDGPEQHLVGDTFLIGGKMSKMAPLLFTGTVTTAETVSPELFEIGS